MVQQTQLQHNTHRLRRAKTPSKHNGTTMKPSSKKSHREFLIRYKKNIEIMKLQATNCTIKEEFEYPIYSGKYLVGVADCVLIIDTKDNSYKQRIRIIEYKNSNEDILGAVRQLKIYRNALKQNFPYSEIECRFCSDSKNIGENEIQLLIDNNMWFHPLSEVEDE